MAEFVYRFVSDMFLAEGFEEKIKQNNTIKGDNGKHWEDKTYSRRQDMGDW